MAVIAPTPGLVPQESHGLPSGWWREPDLLCLVTLFVGLPALWVLGLAEISFLLVGLALGYLVVRRHGRRIRVPQGFGFWLLFVVWSIGGVFVLSVQAPGALAGNGGSRLLVFGYRFAWYLALTGLLLYFGNTARSRLSSRLVAQLMGVGFVVVVIGGWLGMLKPTFTFTSPAEILLGPAANIQFVKDIIHPLAANATPSELGFVAARPAAPFSFANTWGASFALTLPFFVYSCFGLGSRRLRYAGFVVLLASMAPFVYSLNRALWIAVITQIIAGVVVLARRDRPAFAWGMAGMITLLMTALVVSPLGVLIIDRLNSPHSNERRGLLSVETVKSALTGSPIMGFGSTRQVAGNFASIAGGSTKGCFACGSPPLGTQGQLWFVIFAHGIVGLALFLAFYWSRYWVQRKDLGTYAAIARIVLLSYAVMLPFYDTLGAPQFFVTVALGLAWRESRSRAAPPPRVTTHTAGVTR